MEKVILDTDLVVSTDRRFLGRDVADTKMLEIIGVDPRWADYIRVLDRQDNLVLLHYLSTFVSTTDQTLDEKPLETFGHARGIIIDLATDTIVCRSLPYTPEVVSTDQGRLKLLLGSDLGSRKFYNACEGTVLRLFWFGDRWHISTHRKIDADKSYWSGPTFGEMFEELRKFDMNSLNRDYCYSLLMSHDSNRLVYPISRNQLMVIAVYNRLTETFLKMTEWGELPTGTSAPTALARPRIKSVTDVTKLPNQQSFDHAGIITFGDEDYPKPVKIITPDYCKLRDARGNNPSLRSRYLQIRGSPECGLIVSWYNDPKCQEIFDAAEDEFDDLVDKLHALYIHRYVHKNFENIPKEEYVTIQKCHTWYNLDRGNNIVTKKKVREILNDTPNHFVAIMLNRQRAEAKAAKSE